MKTFTQEEIDATLNEIKSMSHYEMCRLWRFTSAAEESIYFRADLEPGQAFNDRLFNHFGGFTAEISKQLGF